MIAYCTYCSAEKYASNGRVPAIELYKSDRIAKVFKTAKDQGKPFVILSGKYGLISAKETIEYYDHLLVPSEVEAHSKRIANQIRTKGIQRIVFFTNSIENDPKLKAYIDCIESACTSAKISLEIKVGNYQD